MKFSGNQKRLFFFLIFTAVSLAAVLVLTVNEKTISVLGRMEPLFIFLCVLIWAVSFGFDALSNVAFALGAGERIRLPDACKLAAIRIFFNLITPFTSGGQPVSIYILHKLGIPAGKGSSIIITRLMCLTLCSTCGAITAFIFFGYAVTSNSGLQAAFIGTGSVIALSYCIAIFALLNPAFLRIFVRIIGTIGAKIRIIKNFDAFYAKGVEQTAHAKESFKSYFTEHPAIFFLGLLYCVGWYVCQVLILFFIIRGLGIGVAFPNGFALSAMLIFLISFMPTPGASGLGEVLFIALFSGTVKVELTGVAVVLWRIFYQYLSAGLGAFFTARFFSDLWKKLPSKQDTESAP